MRTGLLRTPLATVARWGVDINAAASRRLSRTLRLPSDKTLWQRFEREVQERISALPDGAVVVDVGGGRRCVYHHALRPDIKLIATDVSADEIALNPHATQTAVADISRELPPPAQSVDLVVSRAVLEHVPDVSAAARSIAAAMTPNAVTVHLLPCRNSPFGLAARMLPFKPLLGVLYWVDPHTVGQVEFDVVYDKGTPSRITQAFKSAEFMDVTVEHTWAQPQYFEFLLPVFVLYSLYERVVRLPKLDSLASYMIVRASW